MADLDELIAARTVTMSKLMEIAPSGTVDPTPNVYSITMFVMAGLLVLGFFANMAVGSVVDRHYLKSTDPELPGKRSSLGALEP